MRSTLLRGGAWALLATAVLAVYWEEWWEAASLLLLGFYFLALGHQVATMFGVRLPWVPEVSEPPPAAG